MTREETQDFMAMLQGAYPNFNPPNKTVAVNAWKMALEDYEEKQAHLAFKLYMQTDTSGFAPAPGQIIDKIHGLTQPSELNEMEAWSLVSKAIRNSGYNSVEEFAKLPPLVQKAVGLPDQLRTWALDENYNEQVVMSNFQRAYKIELQREKELQKIPKAVRNMIAKVNETSYSGQIEQKRQQMIESANERKRGEIKALEMKREGVEPPESFYEVMEQLKNDETMSKGKE